MHYGLSRSDSGHLYTQHPNTHQASLRRKQTPVSWPDSRSLRAPSWRQMQAQTHLTTL